MDYSSFINCFFTFYILLILIFYSNFLSATREVSKNHTVLNHQSSTPINKLCLHAKDGNTTANLRRFSGQNKISKFDLHHVYGPCSPLYGKIKVPSYEEQMKHQLARVKWLNDRAQTAKNSTKEARVHMPVSSGNPFNNLNYIVKVKVGSHKVVQHIPIDTGSDLTWIQCEPCEHDGCYTQSDHFCNRDSSRTFHYIGCTDYYCEIFRHHQCINNKCVYSIEYGDDSISKGYLARETIRLTQHDVYENMYFGCGDNNKINAHGQVAGIMGLSRGPISIISQTDHKYHSIFGFCLPSVGSHHAGHLIFGNYIDQQQPVRYIQMLNRGRNEDYYVNLVGISVSGVRLRINPDTFLHSGTILDSGTQNTYLPRDAYNLFRDAFKEKMRHYKETKPTKYIGTCYDMRGVRVEAVLPTITLHFYDHHHHEVHIDLNSKGILIPPKINGSKKRLCLTVAPQDGNEVSIIGSSSLQTFDVIHDIRGRRIGFAAGGCT